MSSSTLLLQRANLIIRDELFPILGIPPEIYGNRPNDIINNLMEIRAELRRMAGARRATARRDADTR